MNRTIAIEQFYTCEGALKKRFEKKGRQQALRATSVEEYEAWKVTTRGILRGLLGLDRMESCPLNAKVLERVDIGDGIIREKVLLEVEPEVFMPVFILIPEKKTDEKQACFLCPPGHQGAGKYSVAGVREIPAVADKIDFYHYDYGYQLAKLGFVALCPDCRGFGERREAALQGEEESAFMNSTCFHLAHMAEPLGLTVAGMCTWDLMRLLDYVEERNDWDTTNIGCLGFSGGGMQTLWLSSLDERIKVAVISGYLYGYNDSLLHLNGNCSCNYVPHLWEQVDMGDIVALIAPRPLMIQSGKEDHLNGPRGLSNVFEQLDIVKKAYRLYDAEQAVTHDIWEGGHCFHMEHVGKFLGKVYERFILE